MVMERIGSRKNPHIQHFRRLAREKDYRRETGLVVCDGEKLLGEALLHGMTVVEVLVREGGAAPELPGIPCRSASEDAFSFASPLENSPGPLFVLRRPHIPVPDRPERVLILENVQDPGNVGTVLRTAAALGADLVILVGTCADPWQPKTVRAAMGALFRQPLLETDRRGLADRLEAWGLPLYGAALAPDAEDIRRVPLRRGAVAIGNEGKGLSPELLERCDRRLIIPMTENSESLNAAVASAIVLWEMARSE